jgi:coatomer subunit beta
MSVNSTILIEQPCYTLINLPQDAEQPSEVKLREDLEKGDNKV